MELFCGVVRFDFVFYIVSYFKYVSKFYSLISFCPRFTEVQVDGIDLAAEMDRMTCFHCLWISAFPILISLSSMSCLIFQTMG